MEHGSLCIVYLFLHQMTFTSGLGNKEITLSDKQSCMNILIGLPLLHLNQSFFWKMTAMIKLIKFKYMW